MAVRPSADPSPFFFGTGTKTFSATCNAGEVVTGGGFEAPSTEFVLRSAPRAPDAQSAYWRWEVSVVNLFSPLGWVKIWAVCAPAS